MPKVHNVAGKLSDLGAERGVLAGLLRYGREGLADVEDIVSVSEFTDAKNQIFFKCIQEHLQTSNVVDPAALYISTEKLGVKLSEADIEYIQSLSLFPVKQENVRVYAQVIARLKIVREAQSLLKTVHDDLDNVTGKESLDEILSRFESPVFDFVYDLSNSQEQAPVHISKDGRERLQAKMDNPVDVLGVPLPFPILTEKIGGVRPGVSLFGARPGRGKSITARECAVFAARKGIQVLYADSEMLVEEQQDRCWAAISKVNIREIETGKFGKDQSKVSRVLAAQAELEKLPIVHKYVGGKPFEEILSIIRRWIFQTVKFNENGELNPCLLIYDYFKLMDVSDLSKMQEYQALGFQITKLSDFSKQYKMPVMAFTQLNRESDISQSDRLLWLCTSCMIMHDKDDDEIAQDGGIKNGNRKVIIHKARTGELTGGDYINMYLDGAHSTIKELGTKSQLVQGKSFEHSVSGEVKP